MSRIARLTSCVLAVAVSGLLVAGSALADKPSWAGKGAAAKDRGGEQQERGERGRGADEGRPGKGATHFGDHHRVVVRDYYGAQFQSGRCPPGLAKKRNGCMPPGQARKWEIGHALPRDVVYYDVPPALVVQLGQPPAGYRYVRVAGDILMIAVGTSMVVDAIRDLGR